MRNIFKGMNKKQKKEFDKLEVDKKAELLQTAIVGKVSNTMAQEVAKAMIDGMALEREQLYNKYVEPIDYALDQEDRNDKIEAFLSFLRIEHLKYQQKHAKNIKDSE